MPEEKRFHLAEEPLPAAFDGQGHPTQLRIRIQCAFCEGWTIAYLWSLAGSGKKCSCGALLTRNFGWKRA